MLPGSWLALHNYFLNHPLDYPTDPVNVNDVPLTEAEIAERGLTPEQVEAINHARSIAKLPREQGGFWVGTRLRGSKLSYIRCLAISFTGLGLPAVISTDGGRCGAAEDPPIRRAVGRFYTLTVGHITPVGEAPPYFLPPPPGYGHIAGSTLTRL